MLKLLVADESPRLRYAADVIFRHILRWPYVVVHDIDMVLPGEPCLAYQSKSSGSIPRIQPNGLLSENKWRPSAPEIRVGRRRDIPRLFPDETSLIGFDIFSAAFYVASRYEEYMDGNRDMHDRFSAQSSILKNHLELPVLNCWSQMLANNLRKLYPTLPETSLSHRVEVSVDIDQRYAWRGKGLLRNGLGWLRDLSKGNWALLSQRPACLLNIRPDPFDTFDQINEACQHLKESVRYFVLLGNRGRYDKNIDAGHEGQRALFRQLDRENLIGLHPSYRAAFDAEQLQKEAVRFEQITGHGATRSRQHFLRVKLPTTYHQLLALGIRHDHSMAYPDAPGFRIGTGHSLPWFDLTRNETTNLWMHPFVAMDTTFTTYQPKEPEQAVADILKLEAICSKWGTPFHLLLHNSSFGELQPWKGWREPLLAMLHQLRAH